MPMDPRSALTATTVTLHTPAPRMATTARDTSMTGSSSAPDPGSTVAMATAIAQAFTETHTAVTTADAATTVVVVATMVVDTADIRAITAAVADSTAAAVESTAAAADGAKQPPTPKSKGRRDHSPTFTYSWLI